jgi:subtilisin family serine protease
MVKNATAPIDATSRTAERSFRNFKEFEVLINTSVRIEDAQMVVSGKPGKRRGSPGGEALRLLALFILSVASILVTTPPVSATAAPGPAGTTGILIGFEPEAGRDARSDILDAVDGEVVRAFRLVPGLRLVELPGAIPPAEAVEEVDDMPGVAFVARDSVMKIDRAANDPQLDQQWGITAIRAPSAWDVTTGSSEVAVAVLDTGMDLDHPDLAGNLWTNPDEIGGNGIDDDGNGFVDDVHGWDFVNRDAVPEDDHSHGTHTAGTVGAVGNNGIGVAGVAWDVSLVPLKICSTTGRCLVSDAIAALEYAVREGIPVSNNSYGYNGSCPTAFGEAIQAAGEAGHLVVASAGNEGRDLGESPKYPAACPQGNVISVAWLADERTLAAKSNYGKPEVDLAAPGSEIQSTVLQGNYGAKSGTSMAGPHVAGTAALLKSAEPEWEWEEIKDRIMASTREVCGLEVLSSGTLDAGAALTGDLPTARACPDAPVITTGPMTLTNSGTATFTFTGVAGSSFECRLDSGPWQACSSPRTYTGVANGSHLFRVTQRVGDGPASAPSSWSWTVDTNAPTAPSVSAAPTSPSNATSASFTFSGEPGASFECRLDDGPITNCTSPYTVSGLADGPHSVTIFQTDRVGNRSAGTTRTWTVLAFPPDPPVVTFGPQPLSNARSASITFSGSSGMTARCRLDRNGTPGEWSNCISPVELTGLADGDYRLLLKLRDGAGNESASVEWAWTVDATAPAPPRIESGPAAFAGRSVEVSFSGEGGADFECRLDGPDLEGPWETCGSPFVRDGLGEGGHALLIRQRDSAGNLSDPSTAEWIVDTEAPAAPTVLNGPTGSVNSTVAEFVIEGESGATAECLMDEEPAPGTWAACPPGNRWVNLGEGPKELRVRLRDRAGNLSGETVRGWTVDTIAPVAPTLSGGPDPVTGTTSASISISTEAGATASCKLGNTGWVPCEGSFDAEGLPDGVHLLRVRQTDSAGNDSLEATWLWIVDTNDPAAPSIEAGPSGLSREAVARFSLETEEGARVECRFEGDPWDACPEPIGFGPLLDGRRTVSFRQVDQAGNASPAIERSWAIDSTPPEVMAARRAIDRRGRVGLSVRATDRGSGLDGLEVSFSSLRPSERADRRMKWTGGGRVMVSSSMVPFWVRVADRAGNRSGWFRLANR